MYVGPALRWDDLDALALGIPERRQLRRKACGRRAAAPRRWQRHLGALAVLGIGLTGTLGLLLAMNRPAPPPAAALTTEAVRFDAPTKKEPPKAKPRHKPRRQVVRRAAPSAPAPNLNAALSGLSFGIPALDAAALLGDAKSLLGETREATELVMTEDAVDQPPRPMHVVQPTYPPRARANGTTGRVDLKLCIGATGEVESVRVLKASPSGVFEDAAVEAVRRWRFEPATYKGQPVRLCTRQPIVFDLG
ncbi:MAG: energy transducer TonB [Deltaproteobacteria bacterium]|nr:MAG: energy transducer TonB [Deltaproteobacteria bacterium]